MRRRARPAHSVVSGSVDDVKNTRLARRTILKIGRSVGGLNRWPRAVPESRGQLVSC